MVDKLMVVAHPDDEIVFGGAHLIAEKGWLVVCVTNGRNKVRRAEFERVMRRIGVRYEIWNYEDTYSSDFNIKGLRLDLQRLLQRKRFKKVVTHGRRGEYGHPQHKVISRILASLVRQNLYAFSIGKKRLPPRILRAKVKLLRMYATQRETLYELCRDDALHWYICKEQFMRVK